jgi:hypothetical protein
MDAVMKIEKVAAAVSAPTIILSRQRRAVTDLARPSRWRSVSAEEFAGTVDTVRGTPEEAVAI